MKQKTENKKKTHINIILIIGLICIIFPTFLRFLSSNYYVYSGDSYKTLMILEDTNFYKYLVVNNNITFIKDNIMIIFLIIQLLIGILCLYIFFYIIKTITNNSEIAFYSSIVLASSTTFVFLFSSINSTGLAILFSLLGFISFLQNRKISFLFFFLIPLINFHIFILSLFFLLIYTFYYSEKTVLFYVILVFSVLSALYVLYTQPIYLQLFIDRENTGFLSLTGVLTGYSIPFLMLSLLGIVVQYRKSTIMTTFLLLVFTALSFSSSILRIFNIFILSLYAGIGVFYLVSREWQVKELKKIILMLIICSFLFSTLAFCNLLKSEMPDKNYYEAMYFIQQKTDNNSIILSSEENGYYIQYFSKRKTYVDDESHIHYNYYYLLNNSREIYASRNLKITISLLNNSGITHIFLDNKMKKNLWQNKEDGLYFLMLHNENFINLYNKNGYEIWRYSR
ncbi:MAG: hypothetical protein QXG00_00120 [Candidatus Woesearchaeota archaeon]